MNRNPPNQKSRYPKGAYYWLYVVYILAGYYDYKKIKVKWQRTLYRIYRAYMIVWVMICYYSSQVAYMDHTISDLEEFLLQLGLFLTQTVGIFKWLLMIGFAHNIYKIQIQLDSEEYHYEDCDDFKPGDLKYRGMKFVNRTIYFFIIMGYLVSILKDFVFFDKLYKVWDEYEELGVECTDLLPYATYMPFGISTAWGCFWACIYQAIPMSGFSSPIIGFDLTFFTNNIYTCVNLINIGDAYRTMRKRCLARLGLPEDYQVISDAENPILEREIAGEVRKLSIHLQDHLRIVETFEDISKFVILGQAFTSTFVLITILYLVSTENDITPTLISQVQYCIAINIQLFSYCLVGDAITEYSSNVCDGIYGSDWLSCTKSVKMSLMISMMRLQRPLYYTIGKFSPLTLNTYLQILKGSYSYYTMFSSFT